MKTCIYCKGNKPSTHFICEVCGVGMCDDCYACNTEHDSHYHQILENCDDKEVELITKACDVESDYICEICIDNILKEEHGYEN